VRAFTGAVPYVVDVNRLKVAYPAPELTEGRVITHEELQVTVGAKSGSGRYYGVINSWIKQMKSANGIFIVWQSTVGVKVLDPAEILNHAENVTKQKIGQTGRAIKNFAWVDRRRLDATGQKRLDHQLRVAAAIEDSLAAARRDMTVELAPVKSLPKPKLVSGKPSEVA
jgi:hypothetical protein